MAVYLDYAATSPMSPEVRDAYVEALSVVGNPSSIHSQGQAARRTLEESRERVARTIGADPVEIVFTSGGTESINLALKGLFWMRQRDARRPIVLAPLGEHHATIDSLEWLAAHENATIEWLPVDEHARLHPSVLKAALSHHGDAVALVTFLWANNEVGTIQPVRELVTLCREAGVPTHVDAVAAFGHLPIDFDELGASALSVSAHKVSGPVGIGALALSRASELVPLVHGGNQQRARSGTMNAAGAVAFAVAAESAVRELGSETARLAALRDRLVAGVRDAVPEAVLRGDPAAEGRLPGNAHFTFPGCEGDSLLMLLDLAGFSVSTGSACQAGVPETSHVLLGMGIPEDDARGALRMTLGHETSAADVDALVAALLAAYASARRAGLASRTV